MMSLWKVVRNALAVLGFICIFLAVSTSDFYTIELGQADPSYIWGWFIAGCFMLLPNIGHLIYTDLMERVEGEEE